MTPPHRSGSGRPLLSGAIAGTATSVGFAGLHHLLISDIWFSLVPIGVPGAGASRALRATPRRC
jgi:hypothetical protein